MTLTQREASAAYRVGWLVVRRVPEPWARWVFRQIADILWRRQGKGVQQLEANLRRVVPGATGKQLRQLSRAGMRWSAAVTAPGAGAGSAAIAP